MIRLERDIDFVFSQSKRLRHRGSLAVRFAVRAREDSAAPILFLFIVPKRFLKRAHDRNQIKRWLREALIHCEAYQSLLHTIENAERQYLVSIRVDRVPSAQMNWKVIQPETEKIIEALTAVVRTT